MFNLLKSHPLAKKIALKAKALIERSTGVHILARLPRGLDPFSDIAASVPQYRPNVIFDVGANVGQSVSRYLELSSKPSAIYCFEPIRSSFEQLKSRTKNKSVHAFNLALSDVAGFLTMIAEPISELSHVVHDSQAHKPESDGAFERVESTTLEAFCHERGIVQIDYLKIDTEGYDLSVLRGAGKLLTNHSIKFVEVEAGMNQQNYRHVPFASLRDFLEQRQYSLFGFYEQMHEWPTNQPQLRRANVVFVSRSMINDPSYQC